VKKAQEDLVRSEGKERSIVGLEKPLFELKNPGIVSIPLGFLAVLLGSLLYRDRRADELWSELYARQNTGILASKATAH
jgi:cation/acetate symporter